MPPQPILSKCRDAKVNIDPIGLRRYPDLARSIADIIATWGQVETHLGAILARFLGSGVRPAMAMYNALTSTQAQMAALQAAARESLTPDQLELFSAVLTVVKRSAVHRNKVAHWLWGISEQVRDALILVNPDAVLELHTNNGEYMARWKAGEKVPDPSTLPPLDLSEAFVYGEKEFSEIIDELTDVWSITNSFAYVIITGATPSDVQFQMLSASPRIRTELEKARKSQKGNG